MSVPMLLMMISTTTTAVLDPLRGRIGRSAVLADWFGRGDVGSELRFEVCGHGGGAGADFVAEGRHGVGSGCGDWA